MPFKSKAQARYMFARHPRIAKRFAKHTPSIKALPERKKKMKNKSMPKFQAPKEELSFPKTYGTSITDKHLKTKKIKKSKKKKK